MESSEESAPDERLAAEMQQELLESCLEVVFEAYDEALDDQMIEPVVFVIDCEDEIGVQIANTWLGESTVRDAVAEQKLEAPGSDLTTVFARAFPLAESREEVPLVFDYLAPVFEQEFASDEFLAIAVTAGGAAAFTVPLSAREGTE